MLLPGCISAQRQIDASQAALYAQAITETERVARVLETTGPGRYDVRFFFSNAFINQNLATLADYRIVLPGNPDIDLRVKSITLSVMGPLPAVAIRATGTADNIAADITMNAVLTPTGRRHEIRINIYSLQPDVRWRGIRVTRIPSADRLLKVRALDVTAGLPTIRLPVEERITIGGPAGTADIRVQTSRPPQSTAPSWLNFTTTVPATTWTGRIVNPRWYFVNGGVYMFGDVR
ncbi:hypothetical protein GCM10011529_27730 [Polymorphobacter glacialis]|uniref:Uncharacterized protein n=1 Tax=Sandarakinorhabdus glacialis TaxID=1614636 RepID=A0A917A057_9SPHN|nr:hypothetical protein [Polymorphobacter glacialis]GGE19598.1 hypothetical protein GCM10011529_27730 [Polymorphobacter glacialis]